MKKLVTIAVVGALAFGLLGPAEAKKKKKPKAPVPVEVQFFLHTEENCEVFSLTLTDGEDATDCAFVIDDMFNDDPLPIQGPVVDSYTASEGVPLKLDPTRKVTGSITLRGTGGSLAGQPIELGMGNAEVDLTLKATIAGEEKVLGTYTESYTVLAPNQRHQIDFELTLDPALAGTTIDALVLDVFTHGTVVGGRGVEHDAEVPPSIKVPALQ